MNEASDADVFLSFGLPGWEQVLDLSMYKLLAFIQLNCFLSSRSAHHCAGF